MATHDHPHPHPHPPTGGPPPQLAQIPVNPVLQELLDSLPHTSVPFLLATAPIANAQPPQSNTVVLCPVHKQSQCEQCGVDFNSLNYMHQFLRTAPSEAVPPPPNVQPPPQRADQIKTAKEAGNTAFKAQNFPLAIQHYSKSADMALSRPPWELAAISRDETAIALCNRSAAFAFAGAWANALADAEAVIALKRPWTKGHFRKSRALVGLGRLEEARDALVDGLQFEPNDKELNNFLKEIDDKLDLDD
ncbi:translocation protein SEC72, partial [Tremellales sp. Uapishka_1]